MPNITPQTTLTVVLALVLAATGCNSSKPAEPESAAPVTDAAAAAPTAVTSAAVSAALPTTAPAATTMAITDELLDRYVGAFIKLSILQHTTQEQLDKAEQASQAKAIVKIKSDADIMTHGILSEAGLTDKEYLDIRHRMKLDPELNARGGAFFERYMNEATTK